MFPQFPTQSYAPGATGQGHARGNRVLPSRVRAHTMREYPASVYSTYRAFARLLLRQSVVQPAIDSLMRSARTTTAPALPENRLEAGAV